MNTPLPLFHRLVVMLEKLNKQPRAITLRGVASERQANAVKPRATAAAIAIGGVNPHAAAHALARSRQQVQKNVRTWRQNAAQTPSNLM
jgi:hypothetical protein